MFMRFHFFFLIISIIFFIYIFLFKKNISFYEITKLKNEINIQYEINENIKIRDEILIIEIKYSRKLLKF